MSALSRPSLSVSAWRNQCSPSSVGAVHGADHVRRGRGRRTPWRRSRRPRATRLPPPHPGPERRPGADTGGHLGADLEAGVLPAVEAPGREPGRGDVAVPAVDAVAGLLVGRDDEVAAAVGVHVVGAVGVALLLVVGGVGVLLELPLVRVRQGAVGAVELVAPDQLAARRRRTAPQAVRQAAARDTRHCRARSSCCRTALQSPRVAPQWRWDSLVSGAVLDRTARPSRSGPRAPRAPR